jgi:hypothetical protein
VDDRYALLPRQLLEAGVIEERLEPAPRPGEEAADRQAGSHGLPHAGQRALEVAELGLRGGQAVEGILVVGLRLQELAELGSRLLVLACNQELHAGDVHALELAGGAPLPGLPCLDSTKAHQQKTQ